MPWEQLQAILKANAESARAEAAKPPVACLRCGAILDVNRRGVRNCPLGHYRWP